MLNYFKEKEVKILLKKNSGKKYFEIKHLEKIISID